MMDRIRAYLSRVIGAVVGGISVWIGANLGDVWALTPNEQELVTAGLVTLVLLLYGMIHRWIDARVNPSDAAKPES